MDLVRVSFRYTLANKTFEHLSYSFAGAPQDADRDEIIAFAKSSITALEGIMDRSYPKFSKNPSGEISGHSVSQGYAYRPRGWRMDSHASLEYVLDLDGLGRPRDARIDLFAHDADQKRLFALHDSIVGVNETVTPSAQIQLDRIESLRSEPFVVERYLRLEAR